MSYLFIVLSIGGMLLIGPDWIDIPEPFRKITGKEEPNCEYPWGLFKCALAGIVNSQFQLAAKGIGIRKDQNEAAEWYGVAAEKGHVLSGLELFKLVKPLSERLTGL